MSESSIGMMEGAFFVPKSEILNWINNLLQLNLTKIEQLGAGSAYCQVMDVLYPGSVKLSRVSWKARNEWEFIVNLKILQQAFQKNNIKKYIEIEKLSKAKYQDNLEFAQWMKRFFDLSNGSTLAKDYDAVAKRGNAETEFSFIELRDNSRMAAMRGGGAQRNEDSSADQKYVRKKLGTRSKSPIIKPLERHLLGNQKSTSLTSKALKSMQVNPALLEERDILLAKFNEIHAILAGNNANDKLREIAEISSYVQSLNLKQVADSHQLQMQQSYPVVDQDESMISNANNRQSMDRFQHEQTIKEEDSPTRSIYSSQAHSPPPPPSKSALSGIMTQSKNVNNATNLPAQSGNPKKLPRQQVSESSNATQNQNASQHIATVGGRETVPANGQAAKKSAALSRVNKHSEALKLKQP